MFDIPVPDSWSLVKLSDLGEVNRGKSKHRPRDATHLYGGIHPFIQTGDVKASGGRIISYSQAYSEEGLAQSRLWPKDTMCITIAANIAETGILQFPACFPDSIIGFIADKQKCNVYFIEYVFRLLRRKIQAQATGSVQDNINLQTLEGLFFPIPKLEEQNRISEVLCSFDDKIELNRQTNQTLEQIAQAIFKSWFVDFDPVKAKIQAKKEWAKNSTTKGGENDKNAEALFIERTAMCVISGKSLEQLEQLSVETQQQLKTTAALFPDALVDSELGEIPEGWDSSTLGNHFNVIMGQSPKGETYNEHGNGTIFFQGRRDFGLRFPTPRVYTTDPKRFAQAGDTLISVRAPVGDRNMAFETCCIGRGVAGIRHKSGSRSFTYSFIGYIENNLSSSGSDGTVFNSINKNELHSVPFVAPPSALVCLYEQVTYSTDEQVQLLFKEIESLEKTRDTLLPKLLSGELTLPSDTVKEKLKKETTGASNAS